MYGKLLRPWQVFFQFLQKKDTIHSLVAFWKASGITYPSNTFAISANNIFLALLLSGSSPCWWILECDEAVKSRLAYLKAFKQALTTENCEIYQESVGRV